MVVRFGSVWFDVNFYGLVWKKSTIQSDHRANFLPSNTVAIFLWFCSCICNQIHIASGNGKAGGGMELTSVETFFPNGVDVPCLGGVATAAPTFPPAPIAAPVFPPTMPPVATLVPVTEAPIPMPKEGIVAIQLIYTGDGPLKNQAVANLDPNNLTYINIRGLGLPSASFNIDAVNVGTINNSVKFSNGRNENVAPFAYWYVRETVFKVLFRNAHH